MRFCKLALATGALLLSAAVCALPLAAQVCNGMPFSGHGMVAASYLSGDAADSPYTVRQYGAELVHQLNAWTPLGTHQLIRLEGAAGRASEDIPRGLNLPPDHVGGSGASAGLAYTLDVLPGSYAGPYVICLSSAVQGQWWRVAG